MNALSAGQGPSAELQQLVNPLGAPLGAPQEAGGGEEALQAQPEPADPPQQDQAPLGDLQEPDPVQNGGGPLGFSKQLAAASGRSDHLLAQLEEAIAGVLKRG